MSSTSNALNVSAAPQAQPAKTQDQLFIEIEGFTKADFNTDKPYIFSLENHNGNEMLFMRLKNKVLEQAKAVKYPVNDAKKQMQAMERANKSLLPATSQPVTVGSGFPDMDKFFGNNVVNYGGYECSENGIITMIDGRPEVVCGHPILITRRYENATDDSETVDVSYLLDGRWRTQRQIMRKDLADPARLADILSNKSVDVDKDTAKLMMKYFRIFINNNRAIIPSVKTTNSLGWTCDGDFVPYTDKIEFDPLSSAGFERMGQALRAHGDPQVWINGIKDIRKTKQSAPIRMMMAASFASVLIDKLHKLSFWTHMIGGTSTGKTVSLRAASTIWAFAPANNGDGWMKSMKSTTVGLEQLAGFAKNLPLCLDELQTIQDDRNFATIVYNITAGHGKLRGARSGGLRDTQTWSLTAISTGEEGIVSSEDHGGANSRVIQIKVADKLFDDPRGFCANVLDVSYGHAGKMFIEGLKNEDFDALTREANEIAARWFEQNDIADKQADAGAILLIADRLAEKIIFHDGILLTEEDVRKHLKTRSEIDDNVKAYEVFRDYIAVNENRFINGTIVPGYDIWGKIEDNGNRLFMYKEPLVDMLKKHRIDYQRFIDWCLDKGVIISHSCAGNNSFTMSKEINGKRQRCIDFDLSVDPSEKPSGDPPKTPGETVSENINKYGIDVTDTKAVQEEMPF